MTRLPGAVTIESTTRLALDERMQFPAPGQHGDKPIGGELNAAIARAVVRIHRSSVGRGPTKAHAFFRGHIVVVVLENVFSAEERTLLAGGRGESVIRLRQELLEMMRRDLVAAVEELTGCGVTALMGDTSLEPDMASHVFVLDGPIQAQPPGEGA